MAQSVKAKRSFSPFIDRVELSKHDDFDKYYYDVEYKDVYRKAGIDESGEEFGVIETKLIVKKRDIAEYLNSQADSVGIASYMRALTVQGDSIENYNTQVSDKVVDYSQFPDTLAEVMTSGDRAKAVFDNLDPSLKGGHTSIEGFLNSLTQERIDAYIKGRVDAIYPKEVVSGGND